MVHSKSEILFESMCKCHIRIPLEILSFVDLKILKIEQEMAEQALFVFNRVVLDPPFSRVSVFFDFFLVLFRLHILGLRTMISFRKDLDAPLPRETERIIPSIIGF